jgi:hypothetical protein
MLFQFPGGSRRISNIREGIMNNLTKTQWGNKPWLVYTLVIYNRSSHCKDTVPKIRNKYSQKWNCGGVVPNSYIHVSVSTFFCSRYLILGQAAVYSVSEESPKKGLFCLRLAYRASKLFSYTLPPWGGDESGNVINTFILVCV